MVSQRLGHGGVFRRDRPRFQRAIALIYPPRCVSCGSRTQSDAGLCPPCWRDTAFVERPFCPFCGAQLPGGAEDQGVSCDYCLSQEWPWQAGRAVFDYCGTGRRLVMAFKHGDRTDVAGAAAPWMARAGAELLRDAPLLVPVPLHWSRLVRRRYNQSALLASMLARRTGLACCPDALIRTRRTPPLEAATVAQRQSLLRGAITAHPRHGARIRDRVIVLIDDVMTTGATLCAASAACLEAGAAEIRVLTLARPGLVLPTDAGAPRDGADAAADPA